MNWDFVFGGEIKILVPVDENKASQIAVEKAIEMAKKNSSTVTALHVIIHKDKNPFELSRGYTKKMHEVRTLEDVMKGMSTKEGFKVEMKAVVAADAAEGIVKESEDGNYDLVMMVSGKSKVGKILLGSVTEGVAKRIRKNLLIVK